ncbi:MAG: tetratricopeptide repeat protein [Thermoflavifilum sp.]|nr:tetratricopeptide repeat protein [Thermoflavifilum sp.]
MSHAKDVDSLGQRHLDTSSIQQLLSDAVNYRQTNPLEPENPFLAKALSLANQLHDTLQLARVYNALCVDQRNCARYLLAVNYGKEALLYAQDIKDTILLATIYNNIGVAYRRLDENNQAFDYHLKALQLAQKIHHWRNEAIATNSIGNIYLALQQYDNAISSFKQSLSIEEEHQNLLGLAINYANIGLALQGKGEYRKAIQYFQISLRYNEQINSQQGKLISYNNLGQAYQQLGDYQESLYYFQRALDISNKIGDVIDLADSHISIGNTYLLLKSYPQAYTHIQEGLSIAKKIGSKYLIIKAYRALQKYYAHLNQYKTSMEMLEASLNYKDSMLNEQLNNRMAELETMYQLNKKNATIELLREQVHLKQLESSRNLILGLSLTGLLIVLIIGGYVYMRHQELKIRQKALQLELQSLRARMNPHFIFNSLNSIHKYIWTNQPELASDYLTKFARLIRMILENTEKEFIPLSREIEFLSIYIELENLRCNHVFHYRLELDESIDADDVLIAPLMIQPFVENAIWHGLAPRKEGGILRIAMHLQDDQRLVVEVEDNGIGRRKASEISFQKNPNHVSMGLRLTEERLKLLQYSIHTGDMNFHGIQVVDLFDADQQPCGTKIILELPVEFAYS